MGIAQIVLDPPPSVKGALWSTFSNPIFYICFFTSPKWAKKCTSHPGNCFDPPKRRNCPFECTKKSAQNRNGQCQYGNNKFKKGASINSPDCTQRRRQERWRRWRCRTGRSTSSACFSGRPRRRRPGSSPQRCWRQMWNYARPPLLSPSEQTECPVGKKGMCCLSKILTSFVGL